MHELGLLCRWDLSCHYVHSPMCLSNHYDFVLLNTKYVLKNLHADLTYNQKEIKRDHRAPEMTKVLLPLLHISSHVCVRRQGSKLPPLSQWHCEDSPAEFPLSATWERQDILTAHLKIRFVTPAVWCLHKPCCLLFHIALYQCQSQQVQSSGFASLMCS